MAQAILTFVNLYALAGLLVGAAFVTVGVARVDPTAQHGTWGFRLLILPASAALWPWILLRWCFAKPRPAEAHP